MKVAVLLCMLAATGVAIHGNVHVRLREKGGGGRLPEVW